MVGRLNIHQHMITILKGEEGTDPTATAVVVSLLLFWVGNTLSEFI